MIVGIGVDAVDITRFAEWQTLKRTSLERIFSPAEIDYCLQTPVLSAQRFAARFAAREAFFKAIQSIYPENRLPFLAACRAIAITKAPNGAPQLAVNWDQIRQRMPEIRPLSALLSLTDTNLMAIAFVTLIISD